jgi:Na+-driven multidrug efflux pump
MGNMLINVLAFATINGLNGALESLISQAYGASQNRLISENKKADLRRQCGRFYNRGRFVSTMIMVPIIIIFTVSDRILVALHQNE